MNYEKGGVYHERAESYPPARFISLPKEDKRKTIEEGRPVFVDKPYIEVLKEGGKILTFEANDQYKERYPKQWEAFENQQEVAIEGTPLEKWPGCTRAECENLKRINLFTVEQLAECTDAALEKYGHGCRALQKRAQEYLKAAQDVGKMARRMAKMEEDMEYLKTRNAELEESNSKLESQIEDFTKPKKKTK